MDLALMNIEAPTIEIANAAAWFCDALGISDYEARLDIHFIEDSLDPDNNASSAAGWIEYSDGHGDIYIRREYSNPRENQIEILAHEMVHFKQYVTGQMVHISGKNEVYWEGQVYMTSNDPTTLTYWESPWELEAFGKQQGLEYRYRASLEPMSKTLQQQILELFR
jgi:hypothetical protein